MRIHLGVYNSLCTCGGAPEPQIVMMMYQKKKEREREILHLFRVRANPNMQQAVPVEALLPSGRAAAQ